MSAITTYPVNNGNGFSTAYFNVIRDIWSDGIDFSEMQVVKAREFYEFYGLTITPDVTWEPRGLDKIKGNAPIVLRVRHTSGVDRNGNNEPVTELDSLIGKQIEEKGLIGKTWKCKFAFDPHPKLMEMSGFEQLEEVEKKELPELPAYATNGGNNSRGKGNTTINVLPEKEILTDSLNFYLENMPAELEIKSASDLAVYMSESFNGHKNAKQVLDEGKHDLIKALVRGTFEVCSKVASSRTKS